MTSRTTRGQTDRESHAPLPVDVRAPGRRLRRPRRKGHRTPDGAIYAGRPGFLANPFDARRFGHARSVKLHRRWLLGRLGAMTLERLGFDPSEIDALTRLRSRVLNYLPAIAGCDIECWCPETSPWCHGDTLRHLAPRLIVAARP